MLYQPTWAVASLFLASVFTPPIPAILDDYCEADATTIAEVSCSPHPNDDVEMVDPDPDPLCPEGPLAHATDYMDSNFTMAVSYVNEGILACGANRFCTHSGEQTCFDRTYSEIYPDYFTTCQQALFNGICLRRSDVGSVSQCVAAMNAEVGQLNCDDIAGVLVDAESRK